MWQRVVENASSYFSSDSSLVRPVVALPPPTEETIDGAGKVNAAGKTDGVGGVVAAAGRSTCRSIHRPDPILRESTYVLSAKLHCEQTPQIHSIEIYAHSGDSEPKPVASFQ